MHQAEYNNFNSKFKNQKTKELKLDLNLKDPMLNSKKK